MLLQMAPSLRCGTGTSAPFLAYRRRNEQTRTRLPHNHRTNLSFISPSPRRLSRLWPRVSYRNLAASCGASSSLCDSSCCPRPEKKRRPVSVKDFVMTKALLWEAMQLLKRRRLCEANAAARRLSLAIAAALSFAFAAWKCKAVYAAETLPVALIPSMKAMWPKTSQVLGVLRSQGLIIVVLLALSAFFSMAETSITTLWPWKVQELAAKDPEDGVFRLLSQDVTRFLTTILIGTTVVNIAATALVTEAATTLFGEAGISAATGVMTVVVLLLTEITPKSIAVHNSIEVARIVVRPVAWLSVVLYPVGRIVTALSMGMLKILGLKSRSEQTVTEEELKLMLRGANLGGIIEDDQQDMIENVLDFKETHVREIMTPLIDVVAIDSRATLMEFRNLWETHQYSRIPVYESRIDNIVGIAYAMDMLDYVDQVDMLQKLTVGGIAHKPAYFIPDSMSVWNLLREFRIRKVHMAVVLNEYGGTIGIATLEDVVEEIVGEIFDESDSKEEIRKKTGYIVERAPGVYDVDANTAIEHFAEEINVQLEEGSYETVSGYVCEAFGYIPRTGESINVVLKKEIQEDGKDYAENDADHHEDQRVKNQKYKLEILSGNAKKVGSVRFEEISGGNVKSKKETQFTPRISKQLWENDTEVTDLEEQTTSVAPLVVAQNKEIPPKAFPNPHAMSERIKSDNDTEAKIVDISHSDMTVIGSEDSHLNIVKEAEFHAVHSDFSDVTSDSSIRDSDEDSKEQQKKIRKRKRRRKRPTEGIFTVENQGSVNVENESTK